MIASMWMFRAASTSAVAIVAVALSIGVGQAQQAFSSPEDAAAGLAAAVKTGTTSAILKVLGSRAEDVVESGDSVADKETRERFLSAYDAKHSIKTEGNKKATLILGADEFPFPIPLVNSKSGWEFDTSAGRLEIFIAALGAMSWMRFRPLSPSWMPRTNMPRRIVQAKVLAFTRNALSVPQARRMDFSGATMAIQARLVSWRREHHRRAIRLMGKAPRITVTSFEY